MQRRSGWPVIRWSTLSMIARFRTWFVVSFASALAVAPLRAAEPAPGAPVGQPAPKLAVVIAVDQLRADYLVKFRPYFGKNGFNRFLEDGTDFRNAHHRHSITLTAPGHAAMLSGVFAETHSIIANEFLDRDTWEQINNVEDSASPLVGIDPREMGPTQAARPEKTGRSPKNFKALTVSDQLKKKYGSNCKVFAASNKDRSAILLGGHQADGAYWDEFGKIVTSTYYRKELPAWIAAFNEEKRVHAAFGKTWERVLDPYIYDKVLGVPDNASGETVDFGFTNTFPKTVNGGKEAVSPAFFTAFDNSPFSAEFLGEFAQRAIREEKLGKNVATDMLCVSFSQVDSIGHSYGPDSHEVMDSVIRMDRVLGALLDRIDREVGLKNCVIVLTADHGVSPIPERTAEKRPDIPSARVRNADMDAAIRKALDARFGKLEGKEYWFTRDNLGFHLRPSALAAKNVTADAVAQVVKETLLAQYCVGEVYTRAELLAASTEGDTPLAKARRSYYEPRDRDVIYVLKPFFVAKTPSGSSHGLPYVYDTHVPLLWYGQGVPRAIRTEAVGVDDLAPTLSALLGLERPPEAKGKRLL